MDAEHAFTDRLAEGAGGAEDRARMVKGPRLRRRAVAFVVIALIAAVVGWFLWHRPQPSPPAEETSAQRPITVMAAVVEAADLPISLNALGTVTPLATVTVRTRIAGHVTRIGFTEGATVRKGDFLAEIDPRPYAAALDQAEGQLARDEALLRNAEVDLARYRRLVAEDAIARQQLDTQESMVRQYRATVKINKALVETAKLDLGFCRIVSPIDGRVGLRLVDAGNFVQPGDEGGIVVVTQIRPISVVFTLPEDDLPAVTARVRAGARLPVEAFDRIGTTRLAAGVLDTIDNRIDTTTGTVRLRAGFDNADEQLFPNQFVTVRLLVDTLAAATLVPRAAVQRGPDGPFVYVITADGTVAVRGVTLGRAADERIHVIAGLQPGERVVTDGLDRLRDGRAVTVAGMPNVPPSPAGHSGRLR
ncbi:MAG: MdtA/MuxA family multidrug efflux RND transporter periplasmic adaptor subunit [Rhodospirillales bacterium]|nr:MdtA/MuxA family multidrug efflux RND transporter periplasmic adaptor subunit [Rhodospirillales bacterium]